MGEFYYVGPGSGLFSRVRIRVKSSGFTSLQSFGSRLRSSAKAEFEPAKELDPDPEKRVDT